MKVNAAVCHRAGAEWEINEIEIGEPRAFEVQVRMVFAGLCHSDEHIRLGDLEAPQAVLESLGTDSAFPIVGGHEGAGVVEAVGPAVRTLEVGDHVALCNVPSCGLCHWCQTGRPTLCDMGVWTLGGPMISDATWRYHLDERPISRICQLGAFAETVVCHETSAVKIPSDIPLDIATLVSCGVTTGFGSVVNRGALRPSEVAVIVGCGGIGSGAVLGAVSAGARHIVAVDPVPFKREHAQEIGATHSAASLEEALPLVSSLTHGRMAEVVVLTPGLLTGEMIAPALAVASKDGRVVCTAMSDSSKMEVSLSLFDLAVSNKAILGSLFGSGSPRSMFIELLELYRAGRLKLDELVSQTYPLEDLNQGYRDMYAGKNIRGIVKF